MIKLNPIKFGIISGGITGGFMGGADAALGKNATWSDVALSAMMGAGIGALVGGVTGGLDQ
ncbi:MAG: hypothetical protein R3C11_24345 [Planctomycetaceae bacterium]